MKTDIRLTPIEITALKAVFYGCNTNRKLEGGMYYNRETKEKMGFIEALKIVATIIEEAENLKGVL